MNQIHRRLAAQLPLLASAIALAFVSPFAGAAGKPPANYDQFIVKFKDGSVEHGNAAQRQQRLDAIGRAQGLHIGQLRRMAVGADVIRTDRMLDANQIKALIGRLRADPRVEYAEVDARVYPAFVPNDTSYATQWHYYEATAGIGLESAWGLADGNGQVVAVLDTGITPHTDLAGNVIAGYDFISDITTARDGDGRDANPNDEGDWYLAGECGGQPSDRNSSWHGTHVAGTVGAVTNNAKGVAGVAFGAAVQPIRVLGKCGGSGSDIADAIVWAAGGTVSGISNNPAPADVINLSLGGVGGCGGSTQAAIDTAVSLGAVVVVSAGNSNTDAADFQPANCNNILTVAALGRTGARASYSNYGSVVEIAAPGGDSPHAVISTLNAGTTTQGAESYAGYQGTSMAAPHVSGVAALIGDAANGTLEPEEIMTLIRATSRTLPVACPLGCGDGLIDAATAVVLAGQPLLMISDPQVDEGNAGTKVMTFTVSLSSPVGSEVTFDASTASATATAGSDFVAGSWIGAGSIPAGSTSATFNVTINGDATYENDETLSFVVGNVVGPVSVLEEVGTGTILNDDTGPLLNGVPVTGLADAVVDHKKYWTMAVPANATNLAFAISGGTGDADLYVRFNAVPTELAGGFDCRPFLPGNTESCTPTVQAGTWHVMLDTFSPYEGLTLVGSYTVPVSVSVNDVAIAEGNSGTKVLTFTVRLSEASAAPVIYDITTANGSASSATDYVARSLLGETIPAGQLTRAFSVTLNGDTAVEANETMFVNLAGVSGGVVSDGQGKGTLLNDDGPTLSIADVGLAEGNSGTKVMTFTARLSQVAAVPVTFNIATGSGTASSATDYVASSLTGQSIPAGQLTKTFPVTIKGDTTAEANETFTVTLSAVTGVSVLDDRAVGTILNDEGATLSINDVQVAEGNAGTKLLTFTVKLSQAAPGNVTFTAATANGSASSATDYVAKTASAQVITAGALTKTFAVTLNGDTNAENNETFFVNLTGVTGATVLDSAGTGTILNDEGPTLSIGDVAITEGNSGTKSMVFTVSLSQVAAGPVTYSISTSNGTAAAGSDYVASSLTGQTINAGLLSKTFTVTINGDTAVEANQTFAVNLTASTGATILDNRAIGTITNDD